MTSDEILDDLRKVVNLDLSPRTTRFAVLLLTGKLQQAIAYEALSLDSRLT